MLSQLQVIILQVDLRAHEIDVRHLLSTGLNCEEVPVINELLDDTSRLNISQVVHQSNIEVTKVNVRVDHGNA